MLAAGRPRKAADIGLIVAPFGDSGLGGTEAGKEHMRATGSAENKFLAIAVGNPEQSVSVFDLSWSFGEYRGGKQPFHAEPSPTLSKPERFWRVVEESSIGKQPSALTVPFLPTGAFTRQVAA